MLVIDTHGSFLNDDLRNYFWIDDSAIYQGSLVEFYSAASQMTAYPVPLEQVRSIAKPYYHQSNVAPRVWQAYRWAYVVYRAKRGQRAHALLGLVQWLAREPSAVTVAYGPFDYLIREIFKKPKRLLDRGLSAKNRLCSLLH